MNSKSILFLSPYPFNKAPSQRLKYEQYYPHFQQAGYTIHTSSFIEERFWKIIYRHGFLFLKIWFTIKGYIRRTKDLFQLRKYDIVYIHLWVTPFGPPIFEWLVVKLAKKVVYDIDDLIYLGHTSKNNSVISMLKGKTKPISLMKKANHVIVCTPKLEEFVKKYNKNITDISSTINTDIYQPKSDYELGSELIIGWSGSHSTSKYLKLLEDVFLRLRQKFDFKLLVIGDAEFKINGLDIESINWSFQTEVSDLKRIDIGLYPLPDEEWVYGKSGLKALQYMALGIPTIATAIGANFRVIEDNISGFLVPVDDYDAWYNKIVMLIENEESRKRIGENGRSNVVNYYSVEATKSIYLSIISSLSRP